MRKWYAKNKEKQRAYQKKWYKKNFERMRERRNKLMKLWRKKNIKKQRIYQKNWQKKWRTKNPEKWRILQKKTKQKARMDALTHYGGNPPKCACCHETEIKFLALDHIKNGGTQERKKNNLIGNAFYFWVRKRGYPKGLQILCHNCNQAKGLYGKCPHKL